MIHTETDKHRGNGAHDESDAQDRSGMQDLHREQRTLHPPMRSAAVWGPIAVVTLLSLLVIFGAWRRISQRHDQQNFVQRTTQLEVNVATAQRDSKPKELVLPGTFQAFNQTTIFPRSNGYVESEFAAARENSGFPANPRAVCWKDRCSKYRCWHARDRWDRKFRHAAFQPRAE